VAEIREKTEAEFTIALAAATQEESLEGATA
jgi:hypothetical protein